MGGFKLCREKPDIALHLGTINWCCEDNVAVHCWKHFLCIAVRTIRISCSTCLDLSVEFCPNVAALMRSSLTKMAYGTCRMKSPRRERLNASSELTTNPSQDFTTGFVRFLWRLVLRHSQRCVDDIRHCISPTHFIAYDESITTVFLIRMMTPCDCWSEFGSTVVALKERFNGLSVWYFHFRLWINGTPLSLVWWLTSERLSSTPRSSLTCLSNVKTKFRLE